MILRRVLGLAASRPGWLLLGAAVAAVSVIANVALVGTSAYLISRAQTVTNVAELALAITAVRVLAIVRSVSRYLERIVIHAGTFRVLADLRASFFAAIEPLAPAGLRSARGGDLLARITADVGTLEEAFAGVAVPPIAAAGAVAFGSVLLGWIDPIAGWILLAFAVAAGLAVPGLVRVASRDPARERITARALTTALALDAVRGVGDLAALDRDQAHRSRLLAAASAMDGATARLTAVRALATAASSLLTGLCAVVVLWVGIDAVRRGSVPDVLLATLPLAAIATFEAVGPLAAAVQRLDATEAAGARLFEVIDARPEVVDPPAPSTAARGVRARGRRPPVPVPGRGARRDRRPVAVDPGRRQAGGRRTQRGRQVDPGPAAPALRQPTRPARSGSAVASCADCRRTRSGRASPSSPSAWTCSTRRSATTSRWPTRT